MQRKQSIFGQSKYDENITNSQLSGNPFEESDNTIYVEHASQIKTNRVGQSIKVIENEGTEIVAHFSVSEITGIELLDNMIRIYASDEIPKVLRFSSNDEAEAANDRFDRIINGENII